MDEVWGAATPRLDEHLRDRLERGLRELDSIDPDELLTENDDVVVAGLLAKYLPVEISIDWSDGTRSPISEVKTQVRDQFDRDEIYTVPASKLVVTVPISGSAEMLNYQASTFSMGPKLGEIRGSSVVIEIVERALDAGAIRSRVDGVRADIDKRAGWANSQLTAFKPEAERALRSALAARKERILNDRAVEEALGIPVSAGDGARPPVAAQRRQISLPTRRSQAKFVPEPVLESAIYAEVLDAVRSWATSIERSPRTANKLDEEELRDLLLGTLNGYWRGAAGGELFNGSGKTDILIREGDRNVFIAECKIWRGPKGVSEALDQLLSYLVWRDTKAALIVFIKTADPAATVQKLHESVEAHDSHLVTKGGTNSADRIDYVVAGDEEGRRVELAVLPVVIQRPNDETTI